MGRRCDWLRLGLVVSVVFVAPATAEAQTANTPAACDGVLFGDLAQGLRFDLAGACARLTGEIDDVYQDDLSTHGSGVPTAAQARGSPTARSINTATAVAILDTRQATPLGELSTNLLAQWQKASHDGTDAGTATVQSLYGSLAGGTLGYTHSLMNFWYGDFQFLATTPDLSVGVASYEHQIADRLKLAAAVESGLPTARQVEDGIGSLDFSSPALTTRLRYATLDGLTLHLSGLLRRADFSAVSNVPFLSDRSHTETGWAASFGTSVPVPIAGTYNQFSLQATYAVDAPQTLGTKADLAATQSELRFSAPTTGWSIVGSFSHPWNARLTSNAFVSYISLDADLVHAQPSAQTTRVAANLYWQVVDGFRVGAEIGYLHSTFAANGAEGFLSGVNGDAWLGFVSAKWTF